jgi:hypothetical protein
MLYEVYNAFLPFRDRFGLNQLDPDSTSDNGVLFTVEYLLCLESYADPNSAEHQKILLEEYTRIRDVFTSCERRPGFLVRHPEHHGYDSMDNHTAALAFSLLAKEKGIIWDFPHRMWSVWNRKQVECTGIDLTDDSERNKKYYTLAKILGLGAARNYWNSDYPDKYCFFSWFGRSPGFMSLLNYSAIGKFGFLGRFSILVGQFWGNIMEETSDLDNRKLPYVMWQPLKNRNFIWKLFYKLWLKTLFKDYGEGGMNVVYDRYYRNPSHPIKKYSKPFVP